MSSTSVTAGQVMDRVARLLNDPEKTDYTYAVIVPYMNMAIEELSEQLEESNSSPSNATMFSAILNVGINKITNAEGTDDQIPRYPFDLVEVQEVAERQYGTNERLVPCTRVEFLTRTPPAHIFGHWCWEDQEIKFNPNGATSIRQVEVKYVRQPVQYIADENSLITMINSRSYLAYKTAALCALFIGENQSRAEVLDGMAEKAIERTMNISSKGRQQIMTRHRPFRAAFKMRGGW